MKKIVDVTLDISGLNPKGVIVDIESPEMRFYQEDEVKGELLLEVPNIEWEKQLIVKFLALKNATENLEKRRNDMIALLNQTNCIKY